MKRKRTRRPVAVVDTSNQIALFDETAASTPQAGPAAGSPRKQALRFEEPDPARIRINEVRLDQLLKQVGQHAPLKMRAWLAQMCFSEFEQAYEPGGRPPYAPRAMVGVILSGIMQGITSLRDLERFARTDLGCWWVSGGIMPDHSILGRFIQRHAELLTEEFFDQLTGKVLKLTGSGTGVVAGDGTVIEAAASRYRQMRAEALAAGAASRTRGRAGRVDSEPSARVEQLERAQSILESRRQERQAHGKDPEGLTINPHEPEAVVQPQKDKQRYAASYKPSVLANDKRVIVAAQVHASSETAVVEQLLDQAQGHGKIDTALFDAGYFATDIIEATTQRHIELLCPEGQSQGRNWNKHSDKQFPKSAFDYQGAQDCYRCPAGQQPHPGGALQRQCQHPGLHRIRHPCLCRLCPARAVHPQRAGPAHQALRHRRSEGCLAREDGPSRSAPALCATSGDGRTGVLCVARPARPAALSAQRAGRGARGVRLACDGLQPEPRAGVRARKFFCSSNQCIAHTWLREALQHHRPGP